MKFSRVFISTVLIVAGVLLKGVVAPAGLSYNGLALTPTMGWNTWNAYALAFDESTLRSNAERIVTLGFRDLGYNHFIIDDGMNEKQRAANGSLVANSTKFPSGLNNISDTLHEAGMKFGVYSSAGRFTCAGYPGALGHETEDAQWWAGLGADYLKYDNCYNEGQSGTPKLSHDRYAVMSAALNATGREMTYALCNWGDDKPWTWASTIANSARMSGDVFDSYDLATASCPCGPDEYYCQLPGYMCSVMNILGKASGLVSKNQPGFWNDLDMLEVGNGGMTTDEYMTHFAMWAAIKSPLIMGNDLSTLTPADYAILTNPAIIALNQDPAGAAIQRRWRQVVNDQDFNDFGEVQVWSGGLDNGDQVVAFVNGCNNTKEISSSLVDIFGGLPTSQLAKSAWDVYDLWGNATGMSVDTAASVLNGSMEVGDAPGYYNASQVSWEQGLAMATSGNTTMMNMLFGTYTTQVKAAGTLNAQVPRHGVGMFRLRSPAGSQKRDEL